MAFNGTDVLVYANTGTPGSPVWTVVGSQRDSKMGEAVASMDVSNKDQPQRRVLGGRYSSTLELGALFVPTDAAFGALLTNFRARTLIKVRLRWSGTDVDEGNMLITKMDREFPDQGPAVISISLELDGAWTALATF